MFIHPVPDAVIMKMYSCADMSTGLPEFTPVTIHRPKDLDSTVKRLYGAMTERGTDFMYCGGVHCRINWLVVGRGGSPSVVASAKGVDMLSGVIYLYMAIYGRVPAVAVNRATKAGGVIDWVVW